jgi:uncharacterized protein (DUF4213/DUF364 family)
MTAKIQIKPVKNNSKEKEFLHISIPIDVLADRSVATLEAVVEYMHDTLQLSYHEIAALLKRNDRTVWTCYHRAKKKRLELG